MAIEAVVLIGINPGTRYLGLAVLKGTDLREWRIKVVNGKTIEAKAKLLESILNNLIARYQPSGIALKFIHPSRSSSGLNHLVSVIKQVGRERGITMYEYPLVEIQDKLMKQEQRPDRGKLFS